MNNHQKKIERLVEAKNNAESDMANMRSQYWRAESMNETRQCEESIRFEMKKLQKIYKELDASICNDSDYAEHSEDDLKAHYEVSEMEQFIVRCNSIYY